MKERIINCNSSDEFELSETEKTRGLRLVLVNNREIPIAWYSFDRDKLNNVKSLKYHANTVKILFVDISPSTKNEICCAYE